MLTIAIPLSESFDEETNEFVPSDLVMVDLEHSLVSLSKWESFFKKPFLGSDDKTVEETLWYIQAMVTTPNVPPEVFTKITAENVEAVNSYIGDSMTATWFSDREGNARPSREIITAEIIYYWMISLQVPFECQNWHLNRLLTLVRVCNKMNAPKKKSPINRDVLEHRRALNEQRKKELGTGG